MCRIEKASDVPMSSSNCKYLGYMCGHVGLERGVRLGKGWVYWLEKNRAVDFECGTRMDWGSNLALMATTPSMGFLHLRIPNVNTVWCILLFYTIHIFLLCRLKIKYIEELHHLHLFSGLLVWLQTVSPIHGIKWYVSQQDDWNGM